ncbi:MAG TPA: hypothetical protein VGV93_12075 [Acidimicrobiales bacterium]|nr:hypothetical protein [Acidimicrobiales bacterium]
MPPTRHTAFMADHDRLIADALAKLEAEDAELAKDARPALEWLTAGQGVSVLTQGRLQYFLWYGLPMKWLTDTDHHRGLAVALGRAFELLGLPRYAALCRSQTTAEVLDAYERSDAEGKKAFHRVDVASGIRPPDIAELEWGSVMGLRESAALSSAAELLELAVAGGDLVPGSRGWKQRQQDLVRAHLTTARIELAGRTLLDAIRDERLDTWLDLRRSPTRRRLLEPLVGVVRWPAEIPDGVNDPIPPLRWLLGELAEGQPLTQTGNLGRAVVQDAAGRFGWWDTDLHGLPRSEDELYDLHQVRHLAQRLGLARRSGRKLVLTAKGRVVRDDGERLWRTAARGLLSKYAFAAALGELTLALLARRDTLPATEIDAVLTEVVHEVGWRTVDTGLPPAANDIRWAGHETTNLLRALNLLSTGGDWRDRSYGLTPAGRAVALETLHHRAIGPRSSL